LRHTSRPDNRSVVVEEKNGFGADARTKFPTETAALGAGIIADEAGRESVRLSVGEHLRACGLITAGGDTLSGKNILDEKQAPWHDGAIRCNAGTGSWA